MRKAAPGWIAAVAAAALATGCSVAPPPPPEPPAAPVEWVEARPAATPAATPWWSGFGEPELDRLVAEVLAANHDLAASAERVEAAAAQARIAGAELRPQIAAALDAARQRRNFVGFPIPGSQGKVLSTTTTTFTGSLSVAWEADLWGRLRAGQAAALAGLEAASADLEAARLSLAAQAVKGWFALAEADRQLALAEATAGSRRLSREQIARRYRAGLRGPLDLRLARSGEAAAAALVAQRRRQRQAAARRLELLLARYPAGSGPDTGPALPPPPPPAPAGLPSELLARRPDLRAVERRLAAAGYRVARARAALYPALRLTGSAGRLSDEATDLLDDDFSIWSLVGGLLQPVLQGGRLRAGVALAEADHRAAVELFRQSVLRAFAEVESALAAETWLSDELAALTTAAAEAEAARRLAEERYRRGLGDYLAVLEAQRQVLDTRGRQLAVHRALLDERVNLHLALGGDLGGGQPGDARPAPPAAATPPADRTGESSR